MYDLSKLDLTSELASPIVFLISVNGKQRRSKALLSFFFVSYNVSPPSANPIDFILKLYSDSDLFSLYIPLLLSWTIMTVHQ